MSRLRARTACLAAPCRCRPMGGRHGSGDLGRGRPARPGQGGRARCGGAESGEARSELTRVFYVSLESAITLYSV